MQYELQKTIRYSQIIDLSFTILIILNYSFYINSTKIVFVLYKYIMYHRKENLRQENIKIKEILHKRKTILNEYIYNKIKIKMYI